MKLLLKSLGALIGLLLLALILLVLLFDPNIFKPRIEALAREQGIALTINGDLGWSLWPSLGIDVHDVQVAALSAPDQPIAQLEEASLLVAIRPLFSGEVSVHHIVVDGAAIDLKVDEQGTGNWEPLTSSTEAAATTGSDAPASTPTSTTSDAMTSADDGQQMQLAVEEISLNNSALSYVDAQTGQQILLQDIALKIAQFNLQGAPFDLQLSLAARVGNTNPDSTTLNVETRLQHQMQLAEDFSTAELRDGQLTLTVKGAQSADMDVRYQVSATELQDAMRFNGELEIPSFNLKNLLAALGTSMETAESYALTEVAVETQFTGSQNDIAFDPLTIKLDKTTIKGTVAVTDFSTTALKVVLNGDEINVDHYLAPSSDTETATPTASTGDEELIPLETIKTLNADISADFAQLTVADMPLKNIAVRTTAKDGLINLSKMQATAYDGVITANGRLDGRGDTAAINFDGKVDSIQLEPFLSDMELNEKINFTGAISATTTGSTRGVTMNQLLDTLTNETTITGAEVRLFPLNIEQKFCQLVNLVNRVDDPQKTWEDFTEMENLAGKITVANRIVTVESFTAGIEQLMLGTNGSVDLVEDRYDFRLPLKLIPTATTTETTAEGTTVAATSADGCIIGSNYWLNRSLSLLRCRGSLTDLNPVRDCRPDSKALASLTKDFAEYKLREKHGDKIDAVEQKVDAKKDELRNKLEEKLGGEGAGEKAEGLLKSIFKKKQDEQ